MHRRVACRQRDLSRVRASALLLLLCVGFQQAVGAKPVLEFLVALQDLILRRARLKPIEMFWAPQLGRNLPTAKPWATPLRSHDHLVACLLDKHVEPFQRARAAAFREGVQICFAATRRTPRVHRLGGASSLAGSGRTAPP